MLQRNDIVSLHMDACKSDVFVVSRVGGKKVVGRTVFRTITNPSTLETTVLTARFVPWSEASNK